MWDLLDKKVVRTREIIIMKDKTMEDWKQKNCFIFPTVRNSTETERKLVLRDEY